MLLFLFHVLFYIIVCTETTLYVQMISILMRRKRFQREKRAATPKKKCVTNFYLSLNDNNDNTSSDWIPHASSLLYVFLRIFFHLAWIDSQFFLLFCFENSKKCTHLNDGWLTCNGIAWLYLRWHVVACAFDNNNALLYSRMKSLKTFHSGSDGTWPPHNSLHFCEKL